MKAETYFITSLDVIKEVIDRVKQIVPGHNIKVTIGNAGTKSAKQRGLEWNWYTDISLSGKGGKHCDTKEGVHLVYKYRFALPIMCREDVYFADLWAGWLKMCDTMVDREERLLFFVDKHVHTEKLPVPLMAEYLTDIQKDCIQKGIYIREPQFRGLLDY